MWSWQESTRPHTRPQDHPREPHRLTRGLLLPQKQPTSTVLGHEGQVPYGTKENVQQHEATRCSPHQGGKERHIDGHSLMEEAYHKFHHKSEEAPMDQDQGSPTVYRTRTCSAHKTVLRYEYESIHHTDAPTFFLQKQ